MDIKRRALRRRYKTQKGYKSVLCCRIISHSIKKFVYNLIIDVLKIIIQIREIYTYVYKSSTI